MIGLPSLHALDGAQGARIWLAAEAADMRCGFDRLAERVKAVVGEDPLGGLLGAKKREKGGRGCFLLELPPMLLMGLMLGGGYLCVFARFCDTFRVVLARAERRGQRQGRGWLLWSPTLASRTGSRQGWGTRRLRRFFGYFLALCLPSGGLILLCAFGG